MAEFDADLLSIQEARTLAVAAKAAQEQWAQASQERWTGSAPPWPRPGPPPRPSLGRPGRGRRPATACAEHKTLKNQLCSTLLWEQPPGRRRPSA